MSQPIEHGCPRCDQQPGEWCGELNSLLVVVPTVGLIHEERRVATAEHDAAALCEQGGQVQEATRANMRHWLDVRGI